MPAVIDAAAAEAPMAKRAKTEEGGASHPAEKLRAVKLRDGAILPVRGSAFAAGYDLSACEGTSIPKGGRGIVKTGLTIAIPMGTYARIAPRSGLAVKKGIQVGAGVVDYDYRGEVGVVLFNHGDEDFVVNSGDRVAQLILEKIETPEVEEIATVEDLGSTERGAGGYGSTGK